MLAKGARRYGAQIFEKSPVEEIIKKNGKISGVKVNGQKIDCEYIVLASGMWSRQIGEKAGVSIPLYPAEHFYIITEPIENLSKTLPVIRDYDNRTYIKEDAGKILVGIFELTKCQKISLLVNSKKILNISNLIWHQQLKDFLF